MPGQPVPCEEVAAFTETFLDTGWEYDRGSPANDPAELVATSSAVVLGQLTAVEPFSTDDRQGVAYGFEVTEVLSQTAGPDLRPGVLEIHQDRSPADRNFGQLQSQLPTAMAVAFIYQPTDQPGGWWIPALEGLWVECLDEAGASALGGDIIDDGAWASITDLDGLVAAIRAVAPN